MSDLKNTYRFWSASLDLAQAVLDLYLPVLEFDLSIASIVPEAIGSTELTVSLYENSVAEETTPVSIFNFDRRTNEKKPFKLFITNSVTGPGNEIQKRTTFGANSDKKTDLATVKSIILKKGSSYRLNVTTVGGSRIAVPIVFESLK
jgi:hypothetical protein